MAEKLTANQASPATTSSSTSSSSATSATSTPSASASALPAVSSTTSSNTTSKSTPAPVANTSPPAMDPNPPTKKAIKFIGKNFKKSYQMFLSFSEAPSDPFIYYELPIPHINFFFNSSNEVNVFEFEYVDRLAVGAGVKMSGFPSGGPITWSPVSKGQKATLTMQGHKMKINVENDPDRPNAIEFTNQTNSSYPQTLSLGFVNSNNTFTTIFSNPHTTALFYPDFIPHLRAYYTISTEDLTHVKAIQMWDADLFSLKDTTVINLEDKGGAISAVVEK